MAGHEISGYISSLWQALFASFVQVFMHIFRFTKSRRNNPTQQQQQEQDQEQDQEQEEEQELRNDQNNQTGTNHLSTSATATETAITTATAPAPAPAPAPASAHVPATATTTANAATTSATIRTTGTTTTTTTAVTTTTQSISQWNNQHDPSSSHSINLNTPTPENHQYQNQNHTFHLGTYTPTSTHTQSHSHLHQHPHLHTRANNHTLINAHTNDDDHRLQDSTSDHDIEKGVSPEDQEGDEAGEVDSGEEDIMPRTKGRGGQKRNNAKPNGPRANGNLQDHGNRPSTGPEPTRPGIDAASATGQQNDKGSKTASSRPAPAGSATTSINQGPAPPQCPSYFDNVPASAVVVPATNQRDTKPNGSRIQPDVCSVNDLRRGGGPKNTVPGKDPKDAPPHDATKPQKPLVAPIPLAPGENRTLSQRPSANKTATGDYADAASGRPSGQENIPPDTQADQLRTAMEDLALERTPEPVRGHTADQGTTGNAAGKGAPQVLPVPLIVPYPGVNKQATPKGPGSPALLGPTLPGLIEPKTEEERKEREYHRSFMREALRMGDLALQTNETPVGCVLVYHGRIIAKGMNATNVTRNGTRHAELMALSALFSRPLSDDVRDVNNNPALDDASWGDVDPQDGHIFPYGQKLHPAPIVSHSIVSECILYVTVEPCVMCASLLRQLGIKKVYFGAVNDKFGGTGGVFRIHLNSKPVQKSNDRPYQNGYGPQDVDRIVKGRAAPAPRDDDDGDGGNVEDGYPVEGGYLRDEAVSLLRRFYVQENGRAPQPRKKEGRAARLHAMEAAAKGCSASEQSEPDTPVDGADAPNSDTHAMLPDNDNTTKLVPTPLELTPKLTPMSDAPLSQPPHTVS